MQALAYFELNDKTLSSVKFDAETLSHVSAAARRQEVHNHGSDHFRGMMKNECRAMMPNYLRRLDDPMVTAVTNRKMPDSTLKYSRQSAAILDVCRQFLGGDIFKVDS